MAFSKSRLKRFNDIKEMAPPVGTYDPRDVKKESSALLFDKTGRFIDHKDDMPGPGDFNISNVSAFGNTSVLFSSTPIKRHLNSSSKSGDEKDKTGRQESAAEIKELEKEVKKLFQDNLHQARILAHRDEDIKKLESRLQNALSDSSSMLAKVASLEKDIKDLHKSNDVLKNKLSSVESTVKKKDDKLFTELTEVGKTLEAKEKEVMAIKDMISKALSVLLKDLVACDALQSDDIKTGQCNLEFCDSLAAKIEKAHKGMETLKSREQMMISDLKNQMSKLSSENEELKKKEEEVRLKLEHDKQWLMSRCKTVRHLSSVVKLQNWEYEDQIRFLKGEIFAVGDEKENTEQQAFEAEAETAGLLEKIEMLEESEEKLTEKLQTITEKCNSLDISLAEERQKHVGCLSELGDKLEIEIQTSTTLQKQLTVEQIEKEKLKETLQEANAYVGELNQMVDCLTQENNTIMNNVNNAQNHLSFLKDTCHCLTRQNESLKMQVATLTDCKSNLTFQIRELVFSHKDTVDLYVQQIKDLQKESEALGNKNQHLYENVEELSALKNSLCGQLLEADNSRTDLVLQHNLEIKQKQTEIENLSTKTKQYEVLLCEKQNIVEQKHQEIEELYTQGKHHTMLIKEKQNDIDELVQIKENQTKKLDQLMDELSQVKKELSRVVNELATVETENVSLSDKLVTLKEEKHKTEDAQDIKVKSLADQCSQLQKALDDTESVNNQTTADLKTQLEHSTESINVLQQQLAEKLKIIDKNNEHLDELTCELDAMKLHSKDLKLLSEGKDKQISELNHMLSDARGTVDALTEELDAKTTDSKLLHGHIDTLTSRLSLELESRQSLTEMYRMQLVRLEEENTKLTTELAQQEQSIAMLQQSKQNLLDENIANKEMYSVKTSELEEKLKSFKNEWMDSRQEMVEFHESEIQDREAVITHLEETCAELRQELTCVTTERDSQDLNAAKLEITKWKSQYEQLLDKVSPFMAQIDAFELERQILLGESKNAMAAIDKLGQEYAHLLGHQNHKQKIKHIEKMRAEKQALTKEVAGLRETTSKQKWTIDKLQTKIRDLENKKSFDPSKAFKHGIAGKENNYSLVSSSLQGSPLKAGNRH